MMQIQNFLINSLNTRDSTSNISISSNKAAQEAFNTRTLERINISIRKNTSTEIEIIRKIKNYPLAMPLILTVTYEKDLVFVESENPNIWGEGNTLEEAKKSFEDFFLYEFESYKKAPIEKMDFFAKEELKLYKALLNIP